MTELPPPPGASLSVDGQVWAAYCAAHRVFLIWDRAEEARNPVSENWFFVEPSGRFRFFRSMEMLRSGFWGDPPAGAGSAREVLDSYLYKRNELREAKDRARRARAPRDG